MFQKKSNNTYLFQLYKYCNIFLSETLNYEGNLNPIIQPSSRKHTFIILTDLTPTFI